MGMKDVSRIVWSVCICLSFAKAGVGQSLYFPPRTGDAWATVTPASLGWCEEGLDPLYALLEQENTKAFIVLHGGRIALEKYFGSFTQDSIWYWASAGKTLTGFLVGMAQEQGFLSLGDTSSHYLGDGWTSCTTADELKRTIWHQLTMTTAFDDSGDPYCTRPECLACLAEPGTRWAYHNGPYTLLDNVLESATGQSLNLFIQQRLRAKTGINGLFVQTGDNNVFFSRPRIMARFGLLLQANGVWDGETVLGDTAYLRAMRNPSQSLNKSYGYLTWLNGQESFMLPGLQVVFPGSMMPFAPDDMFMALGKDGQYINVVPSLDLVLIRMGNAPANDLVPVLLNNMIWEKMNDVLCLATSAVTPQSVSRAGLTYWAVDREVVMTWGESAFNVSLYDVTGRLLETGTAVDGTIRLGVPENFQGIVIIRAERNDGGTQVRQTGKVLID